MHSFFYKNQSIYPEARLFLFFGTFSLKLFMSCSYLWGKLGLFWLYTLFLPIWPFICLQFSHSRLRVVLNTLQCSIESPFLHVSWIHRAKVLCFIICLESSDIRFADFNPRVFWVRMFMELNFTFLGITIWGSRLLTVLSAFIVLPLTFGSRIHH